MTDSQQESHWTRSYLPIGLRLERASYAAALGVILLVWLVSRLAPGLMDFPEWILAIAVGWLAMSVWLFRPAEYVEHNSLTGAIRVATPVGRAVMEPDRVKSVSPPHYSCGEEWALTYVWPARRSPWDPLFWRLTLPGDALESLTEAMGRGHSEPTFPADGASGLG